METAGPLMEAMVRKVTADRVLSLPRDISTVTGGGSCSSPWPGAELRRGKEVAIIGSDADLASGLERKISWLQETVTLLQRVL
jgi:hypothetical protein